MIGPGRMNLLFIHPTTFGQFERLVPALAQRSALRIVFLCRNVLCDAPPGIRIKRYRVDQAELPALETCLREAEAVFWAIRELEREEGFRPDVVVGHSGWGALMYVKAACPKARLVSYLEWYYCVLPGTERVWFGGRTPEEIGVLITQRNAPLLTQMAASDAMFAPTEWQKSRFPAVFRPGIRVIHEGVDQEFYAPRRADGNALEKLVPGLDGAEELVTYVSRGLEPTRCFPQFMDAVRRLLPRRPHCHVVIAGNENTCYGSKPKDGKPWKQVEIEKGGYDADRVHFTGWLSKENYRTLLGASTVHVYLTTPFILSWSMLEAMSAGCCLVASAVEPVEETVEDGVNGLLADNRSPERIAERIEEALSDAALRERLGAAARQTIQDRYRLDVCLQKQAKLILETEEKWL